MKLRKCIPLLFSASTVLATSVGKSPIRHATTIENASYYSRDTQLRHDSHLELAFTTDSGPIQIELQPNYDLLQHAKRPTFLFEDDFGDVKDEETIDGTAYNVYKGHTMRSNGFETVKIGGARILVHSTNPLVFEGSFTIGDQVHNIQLGQVYRAMKGNDDHEVQVSDDSMVLWSDADVEHQLAKRGDDLKWYRDVQSSSCPVDNLENNFLTREGAAHTKRQLNGDTGNSYLTQAQLASTVGQTAGCPKQREVAVLGAAADCNFVSMFNSTSSARASIIAAFNSASGVYETSFNISLGLGQIVISESTCPTTATAASPWNTACDTTTTIGDRLSEFSTWRGRQSDSYAAWSLLTTCNTDAEIGVAWLGTLCNANTTNQTNSVVSGTNVVAASTSGGSYWRTLAHELGHNFGASHDCTSSTCGTSTACCPLSASTCNANGQYLMNPASSNSLSAFSPCTIGQVCSNMLNKRITTSCLSTNQNVQLAEGAASCGNGIVEEGEDCDCGGDAGCAGNTCCNPSTCKFNAGAVCDYELSACCTSQCQFSSAGTICRASTGSCDPAESCTGRSGLCPADAFAPNGQNCGTNLKCASGQCTSRTLQCQQQMNGSRAPCDDLQCALTCYIGSQCYIANQYFITGTPCGNGGYCSTGICDQGSIGHQVTSWFEGNKAWLIPVVAVVGGLIVIITLYCWISSCVQSQRKKRRNKPAPEMVYTPQAYAAPQPPQYQTWQQNHAQHGAWQNRPTAGQYPQYPSQTHY